LAAVLDFDWLNPRVSIRPKKAYTSPGFDMGCNDRNPTQPALSAALNQRTARVEFDAPGFLSQLYHDFIIAAVILSC